MTKPLTVTTADVMFGHGDLFSDGTSLPSDSSGNNEDFEPLGLEQFWQERDTPETEQNTAEKYDWCGEF